MILQIEFTFIVQNSLTPPPRGGHWHRQDGKRAKGDEERRILPEYFASCCEYEDAPTPCFADACLYARVLRRPYLHGNTLPPFRSRQSHAHLQSHPPINCECFEHRPILDLRGRKETLSDVPKGPNLSGNGPTMSAIHQLTLS
jgi:hypothetical protein